MFGTLSVRRVRRALGRILYCKVHFRHADGIVMAASMLWIAAVVDAVSCNVICKAEIADRNGTAVFRRCLGVRKRTNPYVFSRGSRRRCWEPCLSEIYGYN